MAVRITWTDDNAYEEGYKVYRSESPMDPESLPAPIAELGVDATSWIDTTTLSGRTYHYRVMAHAAGLEPQISAEMSISLAASGTTLKPRSEVKVAILSALVSHASAVQTHAALLDAGFVSANIQLTTTVSNISPCDVIVIARGVNASEPEYNAILNRFLAGTPVIFGTEAGGSGAGETTLTTYMQLTGFIDVASDSSMNTVITSADHYITSDLGVGVHPLRDAVTFGSRVAPAGPIPGVVLATADPSYALAGHPTLLAVEKGHTLGIGTTTTERCVVWTDLYQNGTVRSAEYTEILARSIDWCLGAGLGTPPPV